MTTATEHGRQGSPEKLIAPQGFWAELRDAVSLRTVSLIGGVLLLQFAFILSYVAAFHAPKPHEIRLGIVSPLEKITEQTADKMNAIDSAPLNAIPVADKDTAIKQIKSGELSAALVINIFGKNDTLLISSGGGATVANAITKVVTVLEATQHRTVTVEDVVPLQSGDNYGLTGFYLVLGWIVGGYLMASLLGVSAGARPATPRRAYFRLGAVVPYAIISGFGGALIVDQVLGALTGHFVELALLGALLVAAAATVTMAFQVMFGVIGIGMAVLVFVILGNPSAGGAYQTELLPPFWRFLSEWLPTGAGTDTVRRIVYLGSNGIKGHLTVISVWAIAGTMITVIASYLRHWLVRKNEVNSSAVGGIMV
ncbi:MAG: DUF3533 domain-containing protein [Planctomycetes bacterium]|nr:DUF3533 domain-containing protein [Planctomycetota bacterium]